MSGKTGFSQTHDGKCIGKWAVGRTSFPASTDKGPYDPGPFSIAIDRSAGVTSWDVEAHAQRTLNVYPVPSASSTADPVGA